MNEVKQMQEEEHKEKLNPPLSTGAIAGFIILAVLVPVIGPIISFIYGMVNNARRGSLAVIITSAAMFFSICPCLAAIALPNYIKARDKAMEAEVKANAHTIQIALERYCTDQSGYYPPDTDSLLQYGYMNSFPENPFTKDITKDIKFGTEPNAGELTYIPVKDDQDKIYGYYLFAYGCERTDGVDVDEDGVRDHVIIVLSTPSSIYNYNESEFPKPKEVLDDLERNR
jgi:type II secretory pathway pseudopilin PulG